MKKLHSVTIAVLLGTCALTGCSRSTDKYDVATENAQKAKASGEAIQSITIPNDANMEEMTVHKGEKLPDGTIATEDTKFKTFFSETGNNMEFRTKKD